MGKLLYNGKKLLAFPFHDENVYKNKCIYTLGTTNQQLVAFKDIEYVESDSGTWRLVLTERNHL